MIKGTMNKKFNGSSHPVMLKKEQNKHPASRKAPFDTVLSVLDSLSEHIAVLDISGVIVVTNMSWNSHRAKDAGGPEARPRPGTNYFGMLKRDAATKLRSERLWKNIVSVIEGEKDRFTMDYTSHSGKGKRWFLLSVTPLKSGSHITGAVVSHTDITRRKLAELETKRFSVTDPMTGILNRKAGLESVHRQTKYCERHGCSFTVCFIDLDNLKNVNDNYGHKEGDRVIISFVNLLRSALRESDVMCRLGGDEILLVLQETSLEGGKAVLKRIQDSVDRKNEKSSKPYRIEYSYGFAEYTLGSKLTAEELVDIADRNMYKTKIAKKEQRGGNYGRH
jgi:diguanylate cyclase (GGDEF)-like protein